MHSKEIVFLIKCMSGGGAERVVSLLSREFSNHGYNLTLILTHQSKADSLLHTVDKRVKVISLEDEVKTESKFKKKFLMYKELVLKKFRQFFSKYDESQFLVKKYEIRNYDKVQFLKRYFSNHSTSTVIAFLYDSIFLSLLSVSDSNKLIISERGDPRQSLESKTDVAFFKTMFNKADTMIFQSPDAKGWFVDNAGVNGKVIFNPIKSDLPDRYIGERQKVVVNFCRLTAQKNLPVLINAFEKFSKDFPDYKLVIYGEGEDKEMLLKMISDKGLEGKAFIENFSKDIHKKIKDVAMFVSSSDFEGMSNSMLEAMGMGIPSICTDCPAGGARAIIKDHENGILVPVRDVDSMYKAMKEVVENKELAEKFSINGTKLREDLALDKIISEWLEIVQ